MKKAVLLVLGAAYQKHLGAIDEQQEVLAGVTDMAMNAFAVESACLRARRMAERGKGEMAADLCAVLAQGAMETIESTARTLLAACSEGDSLRTNLAVLRRFTRHEPVNVIALRRGIARRLLEAERYVL